MIYQGRSEVIHGECIWQQMGETSMERISMLSRYRMTSGPVTIKEAQTMREGAPKRQAKADGRSYNSN